MNDIDMSIIQIYLSQRETLCKTYTFSIIISVSVFTKPGREAYVNHMYLSQREQFSMIYTAP